MVYTTQRNELMSSGRKPIKIIKRNATEPSAQSRVVLKTTKQSRREMAKVVVSWIKERRRTQTVSFQSTATNLGVRWPGTAL